MTRITGVRDVFNTATAYSGRLTADLFHVAV
jgi:hypothetical protein